jgi:hypothetical protein
MSTPVNPSLIDAIDPLVRAKNLSEGLRLIGGGIGNDNPAGYAICDIADIVLERIEKAQGQIQRHLDLAKGGAA